MNENDRDRIRTRVEAAERGIFERPTPGSPGLIDPPGGYAELPWEAEDPFAPGAAPPPSGIPATVVLPASRDLDGWPFPEDTGLGHPADLVGYRVQALDGRSGKVDKASASLGGSYLVVDTGLIFHKRVLLPAGTVTKIDPEHRVLYVDRPKGQIVDVPRFDPSGGGAPGYRLAPGHGHRIAPVPSTNSDRSGTGSE